MTEYRVLDSNLHSVPSEALRELSVALGWEIDIYHGLVVRVYLEQAVKAYSEMATEVAKTAQDNDWIALQSGPRNILPVKCVALRFDGKGGYTVSHTTWQQFKDSINSK